MILVRDTSSCHDDYLCQIIFKSHHVRLSYIPDTILEYTNTHTDRVNSICSSPILWRGHKNVQTTPTRTNCKHSRSLSYSSKLVTRPGQHHRTTRPPPFLLLKRSDHKLNYESAVVFRAAFATLKFPKMGSLTRRIIRCYF